MNKNSWDLRIFSRVRLIQCNVIMYDIWGKYAILKLFSSQFLFRWTNKKHFTYTFQYVYAFWGLSVFGVVKNNWKSCEMQLIPLYNFKICYLLSCHSIFSFMCMFCRSLFVLLFFFFWPLCCHSFFDLRLQTFLTRFSIIVYTDSSEYLITIKNWMHLFCSFIGV